MRSIRATKIGAISDFQIRNQTVADLETAFAAIRGLGNPQEAASGFGNPEEQ
jgi:hypothetical protein